MIFYMQISFEGFFLGYSEIYNFKLFIILKESDPPG